MESLTQRVFRLAADRDVRQVDIATALKVSPTTVNTWKKRDIALPADAIMPICMLLEVSPEFLLAGWDHHYPEAGSELSDEERSLLDLFRACNDEGRMIVRASAVIEARRAEGGSK